MMRHQRMATLVVAGLALVFASTLARAKTVDIVAGENFYGDVAQQIAGPGAHVTAILSNPDTDPHLFEADPSTARAMAVADIVIENGADYDPWMAKLLQVGGGRAQTLIVVSELTHRETGANPHLWWDPATMPAVASALAAALVKTDPRR